GIFLSVFFISAKSFAQFSVSATGTNGSCPNSSSVTATAVNNVGTVNYRLFKVVASGDSAVSNYTSSNTFTGLPDGNYVVAATDFSSTDTSNSVTVVSTYTTMTATASVGSVTCANNDTSLTVTVSGGNAPYTYAITSPAAQAQTVSTSATSYTFHSLPVANYSFSVTDACGNTVVTSSSISSTGPATNSVHGINESGGKGSWFVYGQRTNVCSDGINIFIRWAYAGTNTLVSNSTATQLFWRYRYPSGSGGTIYGAGGVANGAAVNLNTNYLTLAPSTDTYPFSHGGTADLIVYDACGDSTILPNYVNAWTGAQCRQTIASSVDNCTNSGIVTPKVDLLTLTCLPYVYSFTDQTDPSQPVIRDTIYAGNTAVTFSGFIPGHTYAVTDKDADSLTLNNCVSTITITTAQSHIVYFDETPSVNAKNVANVRVQYPTVYNGTVTLKILAAPAGAPSPDTVGYTTSFLQSGSQINFINSNFGGNAANGFYSGTYSLKITAGCWNDTLNFTIPKSFDGSITSDSTKPTCGGSTIAIRARLDNPANYSAIIMSGTSGVGTKESFNPSAISDSGKVNGDSLYISNAFSVPLGTYKIGLLINGGTTPIDSITVMDTAADHITIDAGNTGGFVCPGNTTGTLVVAATSSA
ncbi:MAG: SprB repeat-containing protein, partial [Bacteroidetes bacterium]|nr:SprB repeat-containing protein [Bacteroidota bacterium]